MKDAYSFHLDQASLEETHRDMHDAYTRILSRMDLDFRKVLADTGSIGGSASMEFHVLAESGEDKIAFSSESDYAANIEMAEAIAPQPETDEELAAEEVSTPDVKTISDVTAFLSMPVDGEDPDRERLRNALVALVLRGDHTLNELKAGVARGCSTTADGNR